LPYDLRIREPHSPNTLQLSLLRTPWYKETLRRMKTNWIGLRMSPPLLLPVAPMVDLKLEREEEEWDRIVRNKGYHEQQVVTKYIAWDMREEFNKQQQEQHENVDRQHRVMNNNILLSNNKALSNNNRMMDNRGIVNNNRVHNNNNNNEDRETDLIAQGCEKAHWGVMMSPNIVHFRGSSLTLFSTLD
jgi:hypothetical protein